MEENQAGFGEHDSDGAGMVRWESTVTPARAGNWKLTAELQVKLIIYMQFSCLGQKQ